MKILTIILFFTLAALADDKVSQKPAKPELTPEQIRFQQEIRWEQMKKNSLKDGKKGPFDKSVQTKFTSNFLREKKKHGVLFNYSYLDLWIPSKWGFSYAYAYNKSQTFELEFLQGGISSPIIIDDLGSITDQRFTLGYRSYDNNNSFHAIYGIYYSKIKASLGPAFLATVSGDSSAFNVVDIQNLGLTYGLGNRWQLENNLTYGIDWFVINLPILNLKKDSPFVDQTQSQSKKDDVENAIKFFNKIPTITLLKLSIGLSF